MSHADLGFVLKNRDGVDVQYIVMPHDFPEGVKVLDAMLQLGLGPVAEALFAAIGAGDDVNYKTLLSNLDRNSVVASLSQALKTTGGLATLAPLVLKYTTRDGVILKDGAALSMAYTQNYGESLKAIQRVIEINGFFDALAGMLSD